MNLQSTLDWHDASKESPQSSMMALVYIGKRTKTGVDKRRYLVLHTAFFDKKTSKWDNERYNLENWSIVYWAPINTMISNWYSE